MVYFLLRGACVCRVSLFMCIRQISCEHGVFKRGSFSLSMRSCWKVTKLECILAMAEEGSQFTQKWAAPWQRMWIGLQQLEWHIGELCAEGMGSADTFKQEFSATVTFLFLYLNLVMIYFYVTHQLLSRRMTKACEKVVPGRATCHQLHSLKILILSLLCIFRKFDCLTMKKWLIIKECELWPLESGLV